MNPVDAKSFHLEALAPPATYIDPLRSSLVLTYLEADNSVRVRQFRDGDTRPNAARFHIDVAREGLQRKYVMEAAAALVLRPAYRGVLRVAMWVSVLAMGLLGFLTVTLGWRRSGRPALVHSNTSPDSNALVAVLLLIPALFIAVLIRENEHPITKRVLARLRGRLSILLALILTDSFLTALVQTATLLAPSLSLFFVASLIVTVLTILSARHSRRDASLPRAGHGNAHESAQPAMTLICASATTDIHTRWLASIDSWSKRRRIRDTC